MTNVIIYYLLQQSEGVALRMSRCKQKLTEESVLYIQRALGRPKPWSNDQKQWSIKR